MGMFAALFAKPKAHTVVRYVAATKRESLVARQKAADVLCELAVYKAVTTPQQRAAEAEAFFSRAVAEAVKQEVRG